MNEIENEINDDSKEKILIKFQVKNGKMNFKYQVKLKELSTNTFIKSKIIICKFPEKPINCLEINYCYKFGKTHKLDIDLIIKNQSEEKIYKKWLFIEELIRNKNNIIILPINGNRGEYLSISSEILKKKQQFLNIHFYSMIFSEFNISLEKKLSYFKDEKYKILFVIEKSGQKIYESEVFTDDGKFKDCSNTYKNFRT